MKTWTDEFPYDFTNPITDSTFHDRALFFDIETTGFSPDRTNVYLIGCAARNGRRLLVKQFFAEQPAEEAALISAFLDFIKSYDTVITFNGIGFDLPYLKAKCQSLGILEHLSDFTYVDIFKIVSRLKFLLKLPNYKQKSVEAFLGIGRCDPFGGGELIEVYKEYTKNPGEKALFFLKQHNYEDVIDMPELLPILAYTRLLDGGFLVRSIDGQEYTDMEGVSGKELMITLENEFSVPKRVSCQYEDFYLSACGNRTQIRVKLFEGELKFFFDNYRDYYYLPQEDTAVHKSVASYVDREHRKKATASTCYTRKYAIFLPQYEELAAPAFRFAQKDKKTYFELTEDFAVSEPMQRRYVQHIFSVLSRRK